VRFSTAKSLIQYAISKHNPTAKQLQRVVLLFLKFILLEFLTSILAIAN